MSRGFWIHPDPYLLYLTRDFLDDLRRSSPGTATPDRSDSWCYMSSTYNSKISSILAYNVILCFLEFTHVLLIIRITISTCSLIDK